jgi:magnesium chelatase subunit I
VPVPVVDLPLGATEDRVVGALDLERALTQGVKAFEPGLLARANRGFLYIDEVNLLEDHLVDLLIDVAASGENVVEREGLSCATRRASCWWAAAIRRKASCGRSCSTASACRSRCARPTELARGSRWCAAATPSNATPTAFAAHWKPRTSAAPEASSPRASAWPTCAVPDARAGTRGAAVHALGTDGLRGELTLMRAARALAASTATDGDRHAPAAVAPPALRHRLRRDPLDDAGSDRARRACAAEVFAV